MAVPAAGPTVAIASAPGKINLALVSGPPDESGFHALTSVFQALNLREYVVARRVLFGVGDAVDADQVPEAVRVQTWRYKMIGDGFRFDEDATSEFAQFDNENHLAVKAAHLLGVPKGEGLALEVHKTVPVAGGMAGGSADAAATLVALNELWGLKRSKSELLELGAQLGADVPACIAGGLALGLRRGDQMTPIASGTRFPTENSTWWVAAFSQSGLSTPAVFKEFDRLAALLQNGEPAATKIAPVATPPHSAAEPGKGIDSGLLESLKKTGPALAGALINNLQNAAFSLRPELLHVGRAFEEAAAPAWLLSGSGPTVVGLAASKKNAEEIARKVADNRFVAGVAVMWGPGYEAVIERGLPPWIRKTV